MRYYIVSWDNLGVEFFEEITEHHPDNWAKDHLFDTLRNSKLSLKPMNFNLRSLILRAQMNTQRHYEIYVFLSDDAVGPEDIEKMFTEQPQAFADWVRTNYTYEIYNNRKTRKDIIE